MFRRVLNHGPEGELRHVEEPDQTTTRHARRRVGRLCDAALARCGQRGPPANDAFADAATVAAMPFSTVADLTETTTEPGEPFPCSPIEGTVWYRIDAAEASTLGISVAGDHFVHFNVYRQTSAGMAGLSAVAWCVSHGGQSVVPVAEGETLYVQLARMPWSLGQAVQLDVDVVPPPPNDAFAAATPVPALPFTQTVEVSAATAEPAEPDLCTWSPSERTIWYAYTPTTNQSLMATGPGVAAYVGSSLDTLTSVGCRFFSPLRSPPRQVRRTTSRSGCPGAT